MIFAFHTDNIYMIYKEGRRSGFSLNNRASAIRDAICARFCSGRSAAWSARCSAIACTLGFFQNLGNDRFCRRIPPQGVQDINSMFWL